MTDSTYYHILSVCATDQASLSDVHQTVFDSLGLNLGKDVLRYRFVPSRGAIGFEYQWDVRDMTEHMTETVLVMTTLFLQALPRGSPVRIYTYWRDPNVPMRVASFLRVEPGQRQRPMESAYRMGVVVPGPPGSSLSFPLAGPITSPMTEHEQAAYYRIVSIWSESSEEREKAYQTFMDLFATNTSSMSFDRSMFRVIGHVNEKDCEYALCARERAPIMTHYILETAKLFVRTQPNVSVFVHRWHRRDCVASSIRLTEDSIIPDDDLYQVGTFERAENLPKRYENDWSRKAIQEPTVFSNTVRKETFKSIFDKPATTDQSSFSMLQHQAAALDAQLSGGLVPASNTTKPTWTGQTTAPEYYCILSICAPNVIKLTAAHDCLFTQMAWALDKTKLRMRTKVFAKTAEQFFDVLDLHAQTIEFLRAAALAMTRMLPHDSEVMLFTYWRNPMDNTVESIMRIVVHWPNPKNAHAQLGTLVKGSAEENSGIAPSAIEGWSEIDGKAGTPLPPLPGQFIISVPPKGTIEGQKYSTEKELQAVLDATRPENMDILPMFRKAMLEEMAWKPPTDDMMNPDSNMFYKCMDHTRWADYRAVPCKHPIVCNECMVDYNKYLAMYGICCKCEREITGLEHVAFVPEMPEIHIPSSVYDLNVLEDYVDDEELLDYGSYHSSDFEDNAPDGGMNYEDEKGVYEDEKGQS